MRLIIALVCLFFLAPIAHATDVKVTCLAPTTYVDGTSITGAVTFSLYNALKGATKVFKDEQPACSFTQTNVGVGNQCYAVSASVAGVESAQTVEACTVVAPPPKQPNPPGAPKVQQVTTAPTAFSVIKSAEMLVLLPVGSAPVGTECDTSQGVIRDGITYSRIDTRTITFSGSARPVVAFAACS